MARISAGLLPYRWREGLLEVFLVHPGGPFWINRDAHAWSIAKGEVEAREDLLAAARREFTEETGLTLEGPILRLSPRKQAGGKMVHAWAVEAEIETAAVRSNTFRLVWPPKSNQVRDFPEVDRASWFGIAEARSKINAGQREFLDELEWVLGK